PEEQVEQEVSEKNQSADTQGEQSHKESAEFLADVPAQAPAEGALTYAPLSVDSATIASDSGKPEFLKSRRRKKSEKPVLVSKPGEVVVSRRLYRSGQSEYLMKWRVARRRELPALFIAG